MKHTSLIASLLIGIIATILTACGVQSVTSATGASPTQAPPPPTAAPLPSASAPTAAPATTLALGVSGIGEVKANQDADLVFQVQGTVAEVKVKEGDTVKQGDPLAILDTRTFDQQLDQAEAALESARAQQAALTEAPRAFDANAARAQVQQARSTLAQLKAGPKAQDLQSAQAALATTQANLQATRDKLSIDKTQAESQVQQAALVLMQAQARYTQAKSNWAYAQDTNKDPIAPNRGVDPKTGKNIPNKLNDAQRESYHSQFVQAEAALHQAEESVQLAQAAAETARQSEITGIQIAEQQVVQAQAAVDKLQLPADQDKLAAAQAALAQAQAVQARLTAAPRDSEKALAEAGVAQAQAALEQAQISRERAELHAPFDGVVAQVNIDPGDPSAPGAKPAISMVDVSALHVDVQISDADIAWVRVGQKGEVRADALEARVYTGTVSYVAPTVTVQGAVRTYLVRLTLDYHSGLRPGMSVRVELKTK